MKLLLIILFGIFASCKVTHVVKCECKGTSYQPFPNFPQEGGIWIGVPDQNFSPNWFHPIGTEPNDTIYISQSVDTMLPVKWLGDTSIIRSGSALRPGTMYINNADTASWSLSTETYYKLEPHMEYHITDNLTKFTKAKRLGTSYKKQKHKK